MVPTSSRYDPLSKLFMLHYRALQIFTPGGGWDSTMPAVWEDNLNTYSVTAQGCWAMDAIFGVMISCWGKLRGYLTNAFEPAHSSLSVGESILLRQKGKFVQHRQRKTSLLSTASYWELFVDLDEMLKFPVHIVQTQFRPDMILIWNTTKQMIMWELTVSWEENMADFLERKLTKYQEIVKQGKMKGWRSHCDPIAIGCREFIGQSLCKALTNLGLAGRNKGHRSW